MITTAKDSGWLNYASIIPLDRAIIQYIGRKGGIAINIVPTHGGAVSHVSAYGSK
jgi:putative tricarboxylic transport membrane protein